MSSDGVWWGEYVLLAVGLLLGFWLVAGCGGQR